MCRVSARPEMLITTDTDRCLGITRNSNFRNLHLTLTKLSTLLLRVVRLCDITQSLHAQKTDVAEKLDFVIDILLGILRKLNMQTNLRYILILCIQQHKYNQTDQLGKSNSLYIPVYHLGVTIHCNEFRHPD